MPDSYTGPVCFRDGWHWSVDADDQPDQKLYLEDDGTYRPAADGDLSWFERYHKQYTNVEAV